MIIDTKKVEDVLMDKNISAYSLAKALDITESGISRLRSGSRSFQNLTVKTIEQVQKWIDDGNLDTIIISKGQLQQLKESGQVEIESPIFAYTEGKGILSKDRIVQEPGKAWGSIWLGTPIEVMERVGTIPVQFFDALDGEKTIYLKVEK